MLIKFFYVSVHRKCNNEHACLRILCILI